jgi:hypothetical protein
MPITQSKFWKMFHPLAEIGLASRRILSEPIVAKSVTDFGKSGGAPSS